MPYIILLFFLFLLLLSQVLKGKKRKPYITRTRISLMDSEVRLVCNYIEKHYADPNLTIQRVCEELHTGESFVETLFEKELGITAQTFLGKVRIHHLVETLGDAPTNEQLDQHATEFGFSDATTFKTTFQSIYQQNI